jgi:hypothetical protein
MAWTPKNWRKAGLESSTGYAPPELLILSSAGEVSIRDPTQVDGARRRNSTHANWHCNIAIKGVGE